MAATTAVQHVVALHKHDILKGVHDRVPMPNTMWSNINYVLRALLGIFNAGIVVTALLLSVKAFNTWQPGQVVWTFAFFVGFNVMLPILEGLAIYFGRTVSPGDSQGLGTALDVHKSLAAKTSSHKSMSPARTLMVSLEAVGMMVKHWVFSHVCVVTLFIAICIFNSQWGSSEQGKPADSDIFAYTDVASLDWYQSYVSLNWAIVILLLKLAWSEIEWLFNKLTLPLKRVSGMVEAKAMCDEVDRELGKVGLPIGFSGMPGDAATHGMTARYRQPMTTSGPQRPSSGFPGYTGGLHL